MGTVIDCDRCVRQHTPTCDDCIVTFLHRGAPARTAVVVDVAERRGRRRAAGGLPVARTVDPAGDPADDPALDPAALDAS